MGARHQEVCDRFGSARTAIDLGSPVFGQLVPCALLGTSGPRLDERRAEFAARRNTPAAAPRPHYPG